MKSDPKSAGALVAYVRERQHDEEWLPFALYAYTCRERERAVAEAVTEVTRSAIEAAANAAMAALANRSAQGSTGAVSAPSTIGASQNLSEPEFAKLMGVSPRTIAYDRARMSEHVHYHFHGKRVLYHMPEAQEFIRTYRGSLSRSSEAERLAIDEVTRRRARVALKKMGAGR